MPSSAKSRCSRHPGVVAIAGEIAWMLLLVVLCSAPAPAQSENEYVLRSAYVYNLAKYVEWPQCGGDLKVAVLGDGPMRDTLPRMLAGKTLGERPIQVYLSPSDDQLSHADVLYVTDAKKYRAVVERLKTHAVLTIGESDSFTRDGGIVALIRVGEQMQIQINNAAAHQAQLKISSRLLNLSTVVLTEGKK